jgi:uncharacterized membrane protein
MDLLILLLVIALIGLGVYLITNHIPTTAPPKTVIIIIAVIFVFLILIRALTVPIPNLLR